MQSLQKKFIKIRLLKYLMLILFALNFTKSFSSDTTLIYKQKNSFFIEAGGKAPAYSLNYARIFKQSHKLIYSWRAGFCLLSHDLSVPLAITAFTKGFQHHFEFSLGLTPYLKKYKTFLSSHDLSDKQIYITPGVGYRYQKINNSFFLSAGFDPLIFMDPPSDHFWSFTPQLKPTAHLALGFSF